jgi:hypothetical protein
VAAAVEIEDWLLAERSLSVIWAVQCWAIHSGIKEVKLGEMADDRMNSHSPTNDELNWTKKGSDAEDGDHFKNALAEECGYYKQTDDIAKLPFSALPSANLIPRSYGNSEGTPPRLVG